MIATQPHRRPPTPSPLLEAHRASGAVDSSWHRDSLTMMAALLLLSALLFGGSRGGLGDALISLLALAAICLLIWIPQPQPVAEASRWPLWLLITSVLLVPVLQWIPLPSFLIGSDDFRQQLATIHAQTDVALPSRIALVVQQAERALWSLLPALSMFLVALHLSHRQHRLLLWLLLGFAACSVILGLAQLAGGVDSDLRPYRPTNLTDAVGLFANRNHFAALLMIGLPIAIAFAVASRSFEADFRSPTTANAAVVASVGVALLLMLGIALSRSRAGLLLAAFGLILLIPVLMSQLRQGGARRLILLLVMGGAIAANYGLSGILQRFDVDTAADGRWSYVQIVSDAAQQGPPLGSGLGSFAAIYPALEAQAGAGPGEAIINHAHNDYAELWLEAGWPFVIALVVFLGWFVWQSLRLWRDENIEQGPVLLLRRLAWIGCVLLLAHSAVDYPLRTTALSTVFALLLAMMMQQQTPSRAARFASPS